ncbi:hypothetical protein ERO13_A13G130128v2 [Gossypium hirsutum]|uniref:Transmembrane protein n=3 Tax=Gossypium TaxID=3633 RepID=A0A5J5SZC5_GOSBA|nr:hypothetical protein ES319_A13G144500v1 [Gossypium barbadense]KAG4166408.1 hypothetical protein ERO13_A13G130128v2 [Gossypium hirsutum]TYG86694.1 hypothetical protein ES288_A13G153900v1 [Gossypium darwinii]TYJ01389.1 hypothetical protein E1A91_A13G150300v1 [Gossypium mustelinum]
MCFGRICMCCTCLVIIVIVIGTLFGFGVFKKGIEKIKNSTHDEIDFYPCDPLFSPCGRPFLGYGAPLQF